MRTSESQNNMETSKRSQVSKLLMSFSRPLNSQRMLARLLKQYEENLHFMRWLMHTSEDSMLA